MNNLFCAPQQKKTQEHDTMENSITAPYGLLKQE